MWLWLKKGSMQIKIQLGCINIWYGYTHLKDVSYAKDR